MGKPLVKLLRHTEYEVVVTSRKQLPSSGNITYYAGDAHDTAFVDELFIKHFDAVVDFMVYPSEQFQNRISFMLEHTGQYFFFSSSRVYAESDTPITETSPRLLDVCRDEEYLATDEYALAKAREENLLFGSVKKNWTIIRPYVTYNSNRLQLGVYEKENWLYRGLQGRTIVFPKDIAERTTCLTSGSDVAEVLLRLICNEAALGEVFNPVSGYHMQWKAIFENYLDVVEQVTGKKMKYLYQEDSSALQTVWRQAQIKYDRLYNRKFDNSKVVAIGGFDRFKPIREGTSECLKEFLQRPEFLSLKWDYEAWADKFAGERAKLSEINGKKTKLSYLKKRYLK